MKLAMIIPTLNECDSLPLLFQELKPVAAALAADGYDLQCVIVDDNSTDGTPSVVRTEKIKGDLNITLVERKERGLATAVLAGFMATDAEILGVMDADLSHPPAVIRVASKYFRDYDMVLPSRNMKGGGAEEWPLHRKMTSVFATLLARFVTPVTDPMSGFFLIHRKVIDNAELSPIGYKILLEILVKGKYKNYIEVPYIFRNRTVGNSKMSNKIIWQYLRHLWQLKKWQENKKN